LGPLQITASSGLLSRKPMDMTARLSSTYCNKQPKNILKYAILHLKIIINKSNIKDLRNA